MSQRASMTIWVYIAEVFPTRVRGKGQSLGSGTHWLMNAILSYVFPLIAAHSGAYRRLQPYSSARQ
jgi:hypothetical protein